MEKLVRNGMVAVVVSRDFGAGWVTCNDPQHAEFLAMDANIAKAVLSQRNDMAIKVAQAVVPSLDYSGGGDLEIEWVEKGRKFSITEYDGAESIIFPTLEA